MEGVQISTFNAFRIFFLFTTAVLIAGCDNTFDNCSGCDEATINVDVNFLDQGKARKSRELTGNTVDIEKIVFEVFDKKQKKIASRSLSKNDQLSIQVPAGKELVLAADAYVGSSKKYHGATNIPALKPGKSFSASFLLEPIDNSFADPILLDLGINNKPGNGPSTGEQFSQDLLSGDLQGARFVLFTSEATNLTSGDKNGIKDLYVKDLATNTIVNVHTDRFGNLAKPGDTPASLASDISLDGRFVVFASTAPNLVPNDLNNKSDIFLKNVPTGEIKRINTLDGVELDSASDFPTISDDGLFIAFYSEGKLTDDGGEGIYLYNRLDDKLQFLIANATKPIISGNGLSVVFQRKSDNGLSLYRIADGTVVRITEGHGNDVQFLFSVNKTGNFVAYTPSKSYGQVVRGHTYLYDIDNDKNFQVSSNQDGTSLGVNSASYTTPFISNDGRYVAFSFNDFIYVKEIQSGSLSAVDKGTKPFISGSGQLVGYSQPDTGNIWFRGNPIFTASATGQTQDAPPPPTLSVNGEDISLAWTKDDSASYYRLYVSTQEQFDPQGLKDGSLRVIETKDTQFNFGTSLTFGKNYYFVVTSINSNGESPVSEPLHLFYQGVKPIVNAKHFFYRPTQTTLESHVDGFDPFGQAITFSLVDGPTRGTLEFHSDGSFSYHYNVQESNVLPVNDLADPAPGGHDVFSFKANDGEFDSALGFVEINFNNKPVILPNQFTASSNNPFSSSLAGDEPDHQQLYFELVSNDTGGSITLDSDGSFNYVPGPNPSEYVSFTYRSHDGYAYSDLGTAEIHHAVTESCLNSRSVVLSNDFYTSDIGQIIAVSGGLYSELSGFIGERSVQTNSTEDSAANIVNLFETTMNNAPNIQGTKISQKFGVNKQHLIMEYLVHASIEDSTIDAHQLSYMIAGIAGFNLTEMPLRGDGTLSNDFRVAFSVLYQNQQSIIVSAAVVAESDYVANADIMKSFIDSGNISFCGNSLLQQVDNFTAPDLSTNIADFLFVVDNSGSMSSYQNAVKNAASDFGSAMTNAGLNAHIGIITTDSAQLQGGDFTNDIQLFEQRMGAVGVYGSGLETGIWFAEQALQSTVLGDSFDGTVTSLQYPRPGATLSVIMLSDEPSQYTYRSGGVPFNPLDNLFLDRNYRVYSIVNDYDASRSQYDDLALQTGGSVASINDILAFPTIMQEIAINAGGSASTFKLSHQPISSTIKVSNGESEVPRDSSNGWQYISLSNSIVFYGDSIPLMGSDIKVEYVWIKQEQVPPVAIGSDFESINQAVISGNVTAVDPNDDPIIAYQLVTEPSYGTVQFNSDGSFTYTPTTNIEAVDSFTFTASDAQGTSAPATANMHLLIHYPPVLADQTLNACFENEIIGYTQVQNEPGDSLSYTIVSSPSAGTASVDPDGQIHYSPTSNVVGIDSFRIQATDKDGTSNTATITVNVVGACPVVTDTGFISDSSVEFSGTLPIPMNENNYTFSLGNTSPLNGSVSISPDGSFTYTPLTTSSATDKFSYFISDATGISNRQEQDVAINILAEGTLTSVIDFEPGETINIDYPDTTLAWSIDNTISFSGSQSLRSPELTQGQVSAVEFSENNTDSTTLPVSFAIRSTDKTAIWRLQRKNQTTGEYVTIMSLTGAWEWHEKTFDLEPGINDMRIEYEKTDNVAGTYIWIDHYVKVEPTVAP